MIEHIEQLLASFVNLSTANQIGVVTAILTFLGLCVGVIALFKRSANAQQNTIQGGDNSNNVQVTGDNAKIDIK